MDNLTEMLLLFHSSHEFWIKVRIKCKQSYLQETTDYELNIHKFYVHDANAVFSDLVEGDDETFYCHCAKNVAPRLVKKTLEKLGCGVGV